MSVTFAEVEAAAARIAGQAVRTPLIESPALNTRLGLRVLIKPETLQRAGAFKFRGAYNRLSQLGPAARRHGVVAFSSGNHAQGVALAARLLAIPAIIVMPSDAPQVKLEATRGYGAQIRLYDRLKEDRVAIAEQIALEHRTVVVPAFDDKDIIAGQGTVGLELAEQAGAPLDLVIAPVGGGGLMAGVAIAIKTRSPSTRLVGVEPAGFDDALRSLRAGKRVILKQTTRSLCDALESPAPGELTFPILQRTLEDVAVVSDAEVAEAMRYAFHVLKLVVEPGGAVGLAALLAGKIKASPSETIGLVLSGGNVDPALFSRVLKGDI